MKIRRIDHVAIAVEDIDAALTFFRDALDLEVSHTDVEEGQGVVVAFLPLGESEVELIEPVADDSGVARFLGSRGPGLHHICLEVADLDAALARLKDRGVRLIDKEPHTGTGGRRIAFVHPRAAHGVLVELYETLPDEDRRLTSLVVLRRRLAVSGRVAAAGTRGFLDGLRKGHGMDADAGSDGGSDDGSDIGPDGDSDDGPDGGPPGAPPTAP